MNSIDREWKYYLPRYRFPQFLRVSCGCLGLLLLFAAFFIFVIAPSLISYVVTHDEASILELQPEQTVVVGNGELTFVRVINDTRCGNSPECSSTGKIDLLFSLMPNNNDYTISYVEGSEISESFAGNGYIFSVIGVSPDIFTPDMNYTVQLQVFSNSS